MYIRSFHTFQNNFYLDKKVQKIQLLPVYVEVFAVPFPGRIPAGRCAGETQWDTRTPDPTPAQMSPYCKTLLSGKTKQ